MTEREGWWNPQPLRPTSKYHYIREGWSLCGKWFYLRGEIEAGKDNHPENCAACRRKKSGLDWLNTVASADQNLRTEDQPLE